DAFVIIVSEETGMVSFAENGKIVRGLTENLLRKKLDELFSPQVSDKTGWRFGILANS
ncbi:MAG: TIGR00159 family protein, partial [Gammaproteobacteria bacterium]|nr:TIGR00159 family protein [Gammaproteobacteria bacterium]